MSNNKQSMKIYTEEQVNRLKYWKNNAEEDYLTTPISVLKYISELEKLAPIELPSNEEIWRWWQTQKFQKEQGEQEYTMLYEIDLPKILKAFIEHFSKIQGGNK